MTFEELKGLKPYGKVLICSGGNERYFLMFNKEEDQIFTERVDNGNLSEWPENEIEKWTFKKEPRTDFSLVWAKHNGAVILPIIKDAKFPNNEDVKELTESELEILKAFLKQD